MYEKTKFTQAAPRTRPRSLSPRTIRFEWLEPRYVLDASVVINEIMYHPMPVSGAEADYEWIELYNEMSINMDISGWRSKEPSNIRLPKERSFPAEVTALSPRIPQRFIGRYLFQCNRSLHRPIQQLG